MKTIYEHPIPAKYRFLTPTFKDNKFRVWFVEVEVLGETEKSYLIKLKQATHNHLAGEEIWVAKKNIVEMKRTVDTSGFWYNKS